MRDQPNHRSHRRPERRIRIISERNTDLSAKTAKFIIDAAALERARLEADAQAEAGKLARRQEHPDA